MRVVDSSAPELFQVPPVLDVICVAMTGLLNDLHRASMSKISDVTRVLIRGIAAGTVYEAVVTQSSIL